MRRQKERGGGNLPPARGLRRCRAQRTRRPSQPQARRPTAAGCPTRTSAPPHSHITPPVHYPGRPSDGRLVAAQDAVGAHGARRGRRSMQSRTSNFCLHSHTVFVKAASPAHPHAAPVGRNLPSHSPGCSPLRSSYPCLRLSPPSWPPLSSHLSLRPRGVARHAPARPPPARAPPGRTRAR